MKQYQHLNQEERFYIAKALRNGASQVEVAHALNRSPSTICREIKRNKYPHASYYNYRWALTKLKYRKQRLAQTKHRKVTPELFDQIVALIMKRLSPEQVCGYLKRHHQVSISHETVYRHVYAHPACHKRLRPYLRSGHKRRRKAYGSGARASNIPNRVSITQRPEIVDSKTRIGDWECDTVIGQDRRSVLVTLVDRKSLYTCCSRVLSRSSQVVSDAIIRLLEPHKDKVNTLTFDNGAEFVKHERIAKALNAKTYFAHPYSSWERGINENTNGLLRQYFPKKTDFRQVSWHQVKQAVNELNNRPRKTRGYRTPNELFNNIFVPLL